MGLDGVELIMEVEDEFKISIDDESAQKMRTVGDMAAYVSAKLGYPIPQEGPLPCLTSKTFYALRRAFIAALSIKRSQFEPAAKLNELVPSAARPDLWRALDVQGFHVPALRPSNLLFLPLILLVVVVALMNAVQPDFLLFLVVVVTIAFFICWAGMPARRFPPNCVTVADLVRQSWPPLEQTPPEIRMCEPEILRKICIITAEQMSVPVESLSSNTRFVDDLGID